MKFEPIPDEVFSRVAAHFGVGVEDVRDLWMHYAISLRQADIFEEVTGFTPRSDEEIEREIGRESFEDFYADYHAAREAWEARPDNPTDAEKLALIAKLAALVGTTYWSGSSNKEALGGLYDHINSTVPLLIAHTITPHPRVPEFPPWKINVRQNVVALHPFQKP